MGFLEEYAKRRYRARNPHSGPPSNGQMLVDSLTHLATAIMKLVAGRKR